jgi:hypothetical protein
MEQLAMNVDSGKRHSRPSPVQYMQIGNWFSSNVDFVMSVCDTEAWTRCQKDLGFEFPLSSFVNIRNELGHTRRTRSKDVDGGTSAKRRELRALAAALHSTAVELNEVISVLQGKGTASLLAPVRFPSAVLRLYKEWQETNPEKKDEQSH